MKPAFTVRKDEELDGKRIPLAEHFAVGSGLMVWRCADPECLAVHVAVTAGADENLEIIVGLTLPEAAAARIIAKRLIELADEIQGKPN